MEQAITGLLRGHIATMERVASELPGPIAAAAKLLVDTLAAGNKVLVMGNGGSAADAQHFAAELVGRFLRERKGLPAIALTTDTSIITALGNDYGFDDIFRRQVEALAIEGDLVIGISTSGSSRNVVTAVRQAREAGCRVIGLLGGDGGSLRDQCDVPLVIPSRETPRIQEGHVTIIHILCDLAERALFPDGEGK